PDQPRSVKPFLFNLFNDPAIIGLPNPFRWLLAHLISTRRAPVAREIYAKLGGKSPLLELTQAQAEALAAELATGGDEVRTFVCMRYWHPMSDAAAAAVKDWRPDEIVLLPLYPQYSTTTSASSLKDWHRAAAKAGLAVPTRAVCCYPTEPGWIETQAKLVNAALGGVPAGGRARVLFSAHGLPRKVVDAGDPYQWQVERTARAVAERLPEGTDWNVCYQSRVGPLEWIGPATEDEIERAATAGVGLVVVPIAFVSEHSETLVELDIEYRERAEHAGIPFYVRVPAVGTEAAFIRGLAAVVRAASAGNKVLACGDGEGARICPGAHGRCPLAGGN
ncbi:MAG: ferrochelatase, partial [Rhodospirillaceae bacterium]